MKKLGKLFINPEKLIKNEELLNLRGGDVYEGDCSASPAIFCCRCGFYPNFIGGCWPEYGPTLEQALQKAGLACSGAGATCNGEMCP